MDRRHKFLVIFVGPSADIISGSLLRPINMYYSLKNLKTLEVNYIPIRKIIDLLLQIHLIFSGNLIIVSGVNPWVSAIVSFLGKVMGKVVVVDFHGFAWLESVVMNSERFPIKLLLLVSERISYKLSRYIITASRWLANALSYYFGNRGNVFVIENSVPYIFEKVINELLRRFNIRLLRRYVCGRFIRGSDCSDKLLFIAPLPSIFKSNILAYEELLRLEASLGEEAIIIVTGVKDDKALRGSSNKVFPVGYVDYVDYVVLLLVSDGVFLPYPDDAICGGVRNKVLEAGYCKKPIISSKVGMMHLEALPNVHYIPVGSQYLEVNKNILKAVASNLGLLIQDRYTFSRFKYSFMEMLKLIIKEERR
jgi:glycosyltransferase involved in cell wall biosynthesis